MGIENINKSDLKLIKSLIIKEMKSLEMSLKSSKEFKVIDSCNEDMAKHIAKLNCKIDNLDTLLKKISQ